MRKSINGGSPRHTNPIPNASRVGNIVMSSVITGISGDTGDMPTDFEAQLANIFRHMKFDVEAAGGDADDIVMVNFWVRDPASQRILLNDEWSRMFPDPQSRPARHTQTLPPGGKSLVQANFTAVLGTQG